MDMYVNNFEEAVKHAASKSMRIILDKGNNANYVIKTG